VSITAVKEIEDDTAEISKVGRAQIGANEPLRSSWLEPAATGWNARRQESGPDSERRGERSEARLRVRRGERRKTTN
jgi:hypothetical protein